MHSYVHLCTPSRLNNIEIIHFISEDVPCRSSSLFSARFLIVQSNDYISIDIF